MSLESEAGVSILTGGMSPKIIAERYEVRDRIGRGAFGEVFEVYDHRLRRLVALKTLPIEAVASVEATNDLHRFHMEARAVARLSHPGIVTVHDFGQTQDFAWIVMELVIGETLKAVLDRGERPSLAETVRVTCALLDALHYAHGRGIVHRDVKPANILLAVTAADGLGEVRLADFGIARIGESQQTAVGQIMGTPVAMSPEQVRGEEADPRSDLWSVGVILYQLLTGGRPFPGGMPAIFHNILTQNPKAPSLIVAGLPPELDTVVATALAKNPKDRYPDAAAMAAAIRAAVAPRPAPRIAVTEDDEATVILPRSAVPASASAGAPPVGGAPSRGWALAIGFGAGALCGAFLTHVLLTHEGFGASAADLPFAVTWSEVARLHLPRPSQADHDQADRPAAVETAAALPVAAPASEPSAPPAPEPAVEEPSPALAALSRLPATPDPVRLDAAASVVQPLPVPMAPADGAVRCDRGRLVTRSGSHPGFGRIVFEWAVPIRHEFLPAEGGALLRFPGAGCLPSVEGLAMPRNIRGIRSDDGGLRIETVPGTRIRLQRMNGNRVVVDVLDGEG